MRMAGGRGGVVRVVLRAMTMAGVLALCPWCEGQDSPGPAGAGNPPARFRVLTSFYPIHIATLNVAWKVPGVDVANLVRPQVGCLHEYQMTPEEMARIADADVLVVNGAGMEAFLDRVVRQYPRVPILDASEGIELLRDAESGAPNPHVWVSISLAMRQVTNIAAGLTRLDPEHAEWYARNAGEYLRRLDGVKTRMRETVMGIASRDVVTFHEAFPYFAAEFGFRIVGVVEREPGVDPTAREMAQTIAVIRKNNVKAVFAEPQYPAKAVDAILRETQARVYALDPAVTGPVEREAYLSIMEGNRAVLQRALP